LGDEIDDTTAKQIVAARIDRARPLVSESGPKIWFIVDEEVLRRAVGNEDGASGYQVMIDQLASLKRMNTVGRRNRGEQIESPLNPNISLQIVPFGFGIYAAMRGPFELITFAGDDVSPMIYFENPEGDVVVRETDEVTEKYLDVFASLKHRLPDPAETNDQIDQIIELVNSGHNGVTATASGRGLVSQAS
jgi:hypothetical protein